MILAQFAETTRAATELVDKASVASDRWLFLAALLVIIGGGALIIRWLVVSLETKDAAHVTERNEWRSQQLEAKAGFLEALKQQRVDFREELALERTATARMAETVQKLAAQILPGASS